MSSASGNGYGAKKRALTPALSQREREWSEGEGV
jgi:hypothetical protein